jgi:hypothetical protein
MNIDPPVEEQPKPETVPPTSPEPEKGDKVPESSFPSADAETA